MEVDKSVKNSAKKASKTGINGAFGSQLKNYDLENEWVMVGQSCKIYPFMSIIFHNRLIVSLEWKFKSDKTGQNISKTGFMEKQAKAVF